VDLFDAVVAWAKSSIKSAATTSAGDEKEADALKKVLVDLLPLIRFPCMSTQDVAVRVGPSGLLETEQVLDLYTYLGMKGGGNKTAKLGKSLAKFNARERKPRLPPQWFKWDTNRKHSSLQLSTDCLTVTSNNTSNYQPIFGEMELSTGVWEWELLLTVFTANTYALHVGVAPSNFSNFNASQMLGYSGHIPAWAFACGQAVKYHNAQQTAYGRLCKQGDVVRCRLDLDAKTLEFFLNDESLGQAYNDVIGPVRPAMSLYGNNTVTLRFPK